MNNSVGGSDAAIQIAMDPTIEFAQRDVGGRTRTIAHHVAMGKFYQLGPEEYHILRLLDGTRTIANVMGELDRDGLDWQPGEVAELVQRFVACGVVHTTINDLVPDRLSPPSKKDATFWHRRLPQGLSMVISQRIPLFEGNLLASQLERSLGGTFSRFGILVWTVLVGSGLLMVGNHRGSFGEEIRRLFDGGIWLPLLAMWVIAKIIHEAGHAVAARHHGVRVGKIGIMFFFLAPLAYVDVTDAWKLRSRWDRIQIAFGGVYWELASAAIAAWLWWLLPTGQAKHLAAQFALVAGPATFLVNANPLLRLDGYYILADLTEIPNLRMHGRSQCVGWIERLLLNVPRPPRLLDGWRGPFATLHAVASILFQVVWMSGLLIGIAVWAKGLGVVLATIAILLWVVLPATKWLTKAWSYRAGEAGILTTARVRLLMVATGMIALLPALTIMPSPLDRRVPVVVQFHREQVARAATDAFVAGVHVVDGQRVEAGRLLIELSNPDLQVRRDQKADDVKLAELKEIQLRRKNKKARSATEADTAASLRRQLRELDQQIASLRIVSQRPGFIVARDIDRLQGRFVSRGEELLRVADPREKELLASVGPNDVQAYRTAQMHAAVSHIRLRGGTNFTAHPSPLRPRARTSLAHPALAASVGGPLPVQPSYREHDQSGDRWQVVTPQMESVIPLNPQTSLRLQAGQIGMMTIGDDRTLAARLWDAVQR